MADYDAILTLQPEDANIQFSFADMLVKLGRSEDALEAFSRAKDLRPDHLDTWRRIIVLLITTGRKEEAIAQLETLLQREPDDCTAMRALMQIKKMQDGDPIIAKMKTLMERPGTTELEQVNLGFGLGKALDDIGELDASFAYYTRANDLYYNHLPAEADENFARIDACKRVFTQEYVSRFASSGSQSQTPIFIVGMLRSGTTLVEQILASHSTVYGAGELAAAEQHSQRIYEDLKTLDTAAIDVFSQNYLRSLTKNSGDQARVTDKMPSNFHHVGLLKLAFPQAKIINLVRDPRDVCLSIYRLYFDNKAHRYGYNLQALAKFANSYKSLIGFWHDLFPGHIYDVCYEKLTADQESESRKLLDYCGLDWQDQVLDFHKTKRAVKTASLTQVRQKMYRSSVRKWEAYTDQLQPLIDGLDQNLWRDYLEP